MSNSKKIASIAFTGAAVTAATMMGIAPTFAASSFTIKANGVKITPPTTIKGKHKVGTSPVLADTTKNTILRCKKAFTSVGLTVAGGVIPPPLKIGVINKASWSSCVGPFGLTFNAYLSTAGGKPNVVVSHITRTGASGYLSGHISGKINGTGFAAACHATIAIQSGKKIHWVYNDANHSLRINPSHSKNLHVKSVTASHCLGAINMSDKAFFSATYDISVPADVTISP